MAKDSMKTVNCSLRRAAVALGTLMLCLVGPLSADVWSAASAVIVYPTDKALISGDGTITLLGYRAEGSPGTVTIVGTGGTRSQALGTGAFSAKTKLDPGENVLELGERKITVYLAGNDPAAVPPGYSPADSHAVDNGCEECHTFAGGAVKLLDKIPALCLRCHDDVLKGKDGKPLAVLHPPAQEGDCLACHPFHRLAIKRLPAAAKRDLCFGCHDDFTGGGKKRMHAPVAKGDCTGCHGAHGAAEKKLLPATGIKLCLLCHADPSQGKDGKPWAVPHPALDDGCPSCHLPHVADAPRLLKKPMVQLCADCHDPFPTEQDGKQLVRHSPVEEGECGGCHAVHGADVKKLLAAPGKVLCVKCHNDPSLGPDGKNWATVHPALDDGCLSCHLPHVAPAAGMLKKNQAALCFDCHDRFAPVGKDGSVHLPVAQGACSLCHAPHGSAAQKLLLAAPSRELCFKCHKDPALTVEGKPWTVPHPALDDGCPTCHLPHIAAAPRLLTKPQKALCAGCHEDKNLNKEGQEWRSTHAPVVAGLCSSCHGPHGAQEKALLKKSPYEICKTCHTEVHERHQMIEVDPVTKLPVSAKATLPAGFPFRKTDGRLACFGCHLPHGSDAKQLWNRDELSFCTSCHTNF